MYVNTLDNSNSQSPQESDVSFRFISTALPDEINFTLILPSEDGSK